MPSSNFCRSPPAIETWREVGSPGEHPSPSYLDRISPVTRRSELIQSRSSGRPSDDRSVAPLIEAWPLAPWTVTETILPETPRVDVDEVGHGADPEPEVLRSPGSRVNVSSQTAFGFADV